MTTLEFEEDRHREMVWPTTRFGRGGWLAAAEATILDDEEHQHYNIVPAPQPMQGTTSRVTKFWAEVAAVIAQALKESTLHPNLGTVETSTEHLLGSVGLEVLNQLVGLVHSTASNNHWPLAGVEWHLLEDPKVEDSQRLVLILKLNAAFEQADAVLKGFYQPMQQMADALPEDARHVLFDKIYVDVESV